MGIMNNVTQSLLGMIFERTTMLIIEKRITYELVHENIKELKSIHLELANRLVDEVRVEPDYNVNQTKRENTNIKEDLTQEFLKFIKISEEREMNREILEAVVYMDIA
jgi:hypothetical protein